MAFDATADVTIKHVGSYSNGKKGAVAVRLMAYDGAGAKIAILRTRDGEDGEQTSKMGRLTADEAEGIAPLLLAAAVALREHTLAMAAALAAVKG